jgi:tetratricopeptide (TPR) repeat protein
MESTRHIWVRGGRAADRAVTFDELPPPAVSARCHARRRGPYSGLVSLLEQVVPVIPAELLHRHRAAIVTAAPHLETITGPAPRTLTAQAVGDERTRYQDGLSLRAAHGVVELLTAYARQLGIGPLRLQFEEADEADATDQEFLAVLVRRADARFVTAYIGTGRRSFDGELGDALQEYCTPVEGAALRHEPLPADDVALMKQFIALDGVCDDPVVLAAWQRADPVRRAEHHDQRAEALERAGTPGARLGVIPFHREHGSDPTGLGVRALDAALDHCFAMGFYGAAVDLARRGRALADPERQQLEYCQFSGKLAVCLAFTDPAGAEAVYRELRARYALPRVQMSVSYGMAMLYTRFFPASRRDPVAARGHINNAITLARHALTDPAERAFYTTFNENGLALVELAEGRPEAALRLVETGMRRLDETLSGDRHALHRSVLVYNRGRVLAALGRLADAKADHDRVIALDPEYAEYYLDRGNLLRRMGDDAAAVADYEHGMALSPHLPELYYNRGDARAALGDHHGALADFTYVLQLQPGNVDALVNRAALLLEVGDPEAAAGAATIGLTRTPEHPALLCTRGLAAMLAGDPVAAERDFDAALAAEPDMIGALANSAMLRFAGGDVQGAIDRLDRAVRAGGDDPALLYNRGFALQSAGRLTDAEADYTAALNLPGADVEELLRRREECAQSRRANGRGALLEAGS